MEKEEDMQGARDCNMTSFNDSGKFFDLCLLKGAGGGGIDLSLLFGSASKSALLTAVQWHVPLVVVDYSISRSPFTLMQCCQVPVFLRKFEVFSALKRTKYPMKQGK